MEYDVFISYSRKDGAVVQPVVERLKAEGYRCWMDVSGIESGDLFKQVIVDAIKNRALFCFSPRRRQTNRNTRSRKSMLRSNSENL